MKPDDLRFPLHDLRRDVARGLAAFEFMYRTFKGGAPSTAVPEGASGLEALSSIAPWSAWQDSLYPIHLASLDSAPIWAHFRVAYEYGFDGRFPPITPATLEELMIETVTFAKALSYPGEYLCFDADGGKLEVVLATFIARWKLDVQAAHDNRSVREWGEKLDRNYDQEHLGLREIALLAEMSEQSVRNATLERYPADDRLPTFRKGRHVLVTPEDARAWLSRRRRFTPTTFPEPLPSTVDVVRR